MRDQANAAVVGQLGAADVSLVAVRRAGDVIAGLDDGLVLHAGPPLGVEELPGPTRGALVGALLLEGRATDRAAAEALVDAGDVELAPAHAHGAVGPMTGVVTASMPVHVVVDRTTGATAHTTINEGLGRVLRFGANDDAVLRRLAWLAEVVAPALDAALAALGGVSLRRLTTEALTRGDECHNRNKAATAQLLRQIAPAIVRAAPDHAAEVLDLVAGNDHFYLNLSMASGKAATSAVGHVPGSSVVTAIAANGVRVGIQVAGTGARWFTAPAPRPQLGRWDEPYGPDDAAALLGDSFVTEVNGLGAFAAAAAPAISTYIGGSVGELLATADEMYAITVGEHPAYRVPFLDFRGTPLGIDVDRVVATGVTPVVNAGFASRQAGVGQVGAGLVRLPLACFGEAAAALAAAEAAGAGAGVAGAEGQVAGAGARPVVP